MKFIISICIIFTHLFSFSQIDSSVVTRLKILDTANIMRLDTIPAPGDVLTKKIKKLRAAKNGIDMETVLRIKIMEEQQKDSKHSKGFYDSLLNEVTTGKTGRLIENCIINIYRRTFTETEIDDLIKFYATSAGKKLNKEYILLLVESVKAAEQLLKLAVKNTQ
jgi:Uncharacterized protein conserved in bacteria (DUF2059)